MSSFTVILNTYNQSKYFPYVFDALRKQTHKDFEVIVTDDGSTDNPQKWLDENPQPFNVRYFTQPHEGMRLAKIQNVGIGEAKNDYIVHVMADSVPDEKLLEEYNNVMHDGAVGSGLRVYVKEARNVEDIKKPDNFIKDDWRKPALPSIGMVTNPWSRFTGNNLCISKVNYERVKAVHGHYWNEKYIGYGLEDFELAICLYQQNVEFIPCMDAFIYHIDHTERVESKNNQALFDKKISDLYGIKVEDLKRAYGEET
jgi:glycosyltransferase involved in cell wall biosynthesis